MSTPPSVLLRVRISTADCMVEPSSVLYLKVLWLVVLVVPPVFEPEAQPANRARPSAAHRIFIVFPRNDPAVRERSREFRLTSTGREKGAGKLAGRRAPAA